MTSNVARAPHRTPMLICALPLLPALLAWTPPSSCPWTPALRSHPLVRPACPVGRASGLVAALVDGVEAEPGARAAPRLPKNPSARSLFTKLDQLPVSRSSPVDADGLGRIVRAAESSLTSAALLQVLLSLKEVGKWELALALCTLLEAGYPPAPAPRRHEPAADDDAHPMAALLERAQAQAEAADAEGEAEAGSGSGVLVDTLHYNVLIATCASARRWSEALELITRMRERHVPRETITYNAALHALEKGGRSRIASRLLGQMRRDGVPPNTITFATAIGACARAGEPEYALRLLEQTKLTGTPRNTVRTRRT